jgi:FkbM family methyltransferase
MSSTKTTTTTINSKSGKKIKNNDNKWKINPTAILSVLLLVTTIIVYLPILLHTNSLTKTAAYEGITSAAGDFWISSSSSSSSSSSYKSGLRQLRTSSKRHTSNSIRKLEERIQYLETKLDSYLAYTSDPYLRLQNKAKCSQQRKIKDLACTKEEQSQRGACDVDNQSVCLDNFKPYIIGEFKKKESSSNSPNNRCVVYDFGIRESPQYGLAFVKSPFNCDVVGFDPSPISVKWWANNKSKIQSQYNGNDTGNGSDGTHGTYTFQQVGAGGTDGDLTLREYDWDQVSIIEFPQRVVNPNDCNKAGMCKYHFHNKQATHKIPVTTLSSIMSKLKHERVTLLKLDVEGSEYMFVERMIDDLSCRNVDQLTLEWHHYDYDTRYGVTSNPQINMLVALLDERCGLQQYWTHESTGWPSNQKVYAEMHMTLYYTLSSFIRTRWTFDDDDEDDGVSDVVKGTVKVAASASDKLQG